MAKTLNTSDALYAALSHLFCVDTDNIIKELKAGLTCTPHANVLTPASGSPSTSSPVGKSFRTGGSGSTVHGVDFPNYTVSNAANLSVFVAVNQYNGFSNPSGSSYGVPLFGSDTGGLRVGPQIFLNTNTGAAFHNNTNGIAATTAALNTSGAITAGGVKSFGFTRTAAGVVKFYINGVVDSAFAGGVANTGTQFGAAWATAELSLIGGYPGYSSVSFDYAYYCDFLGSIVSESEMLRLHDSLTGSDAFALITAGGGSFKAAWVPKSSSMIGAM